MTNWTRTLAVCCALALSAPAVMVIAQDMKGENKAGEEKKDEKKDYASAKEVMASFKEFGQPKTDEEISTFFEKAFTRSADYVDTHKDATDLDTIYGWAGPRASYGPTHEGFARLSLSYLKAKPDAKDATEWRKYGIVTRLGLDAFSKDALAEFKKLEVEAKGDAVKLLYIGEIKLIDASSRKNDDDLKAATKAILADKTIADATKDANVQRDLQRIVLSANKAQIKEGEAFPDWGSVMTVKDVDGKDISLADFKGKIVLLDFWATWCGPCMAEMPKVIEAYTELHEQGLEIIGMSFDRKDYKGEETLRSVIAGKGKVKEMPWRQIYDGGFWASGMAKRYGINSIPRAVIIDADGKVAADKLRGEEIVKKLRELVAGLKKDSK